MLSEAPAVDDDGWYAVSKNHRKNALEVNIISPPDAIVGRYKIFIETVTGDGEDAVIERQKFPDSFILLFNAWCKGEKLL